MRGKREKKKGRKKGRKGGREGGREERVFWRSVLIWEGRSRSSVI